MNRSVLSLVTLLVLSVTLRGQTANEANEGSKLTLDSATDSYTFSWWGHPGRTYFVLHSDDLFTWEYIPLIESGAGDVIAWNFTSNASKVFLKLRYSDIPTTNAFSADFDGDRVTNLQELLNGIDPLIATNTDGDALPDDWELANYSHRLEDGSGDLDGDGIKDGQEFAAGTDPNDYYNGIPPVISLSAVGNSTVDYGFTIPGPIVVSVKNAAGEPLVNAPVWAAIPYGMWLANDSSLTHFESGGLLPN